MLNLLMTDTVSKAKVTVDGMSKGEVFGNSLIYTLIGMGIVFIVLILIALLISAFKIINKLEARYSNKEKSATTVVAEITEQKIEETEEATDTTDEFELVAVITAAIASALNTSSDSLVVRSIRKVR